MRRPCIFSVVPVNIASGLSLVGALNNGQVGKAYNQTATATGGLGPYKWTLASGQLPKGLTLNATSGVVLGNPTVAGNYSFSIMVTDAEKNPATFTQSYAISTMAPPLVVTVEPFPACTVSIPCSGQLHATGGTPPYTWAVAPGTTFAEAPASYLPSGLTLASDGSFQGIPIQSSQSPYGSGLEPANLVVQVTDSATPPVVVSSRDNTLLFVSGLKIVSIPLPDAMVGVPYRSPAPVASGGLPPYTWQIATMNPSTATEYSAITATGVLVSTGNGPITPGPNALLYKVFDSEASPDDVTQTATLTVDPASVSSSTTLTSPNSTAGTGQAVTLTASVTSTVTATGLVTFYSGTTSLGTAMLDATGKAVLSTTFSATGSYSITATYAGVTGVAGSVSAPFMLTVITPAVNASFSPGTLTVNSGGSGTLTLTLTPVGGYTGSVTFSCGTLPAHVTCTFAPQTLTITGSGAVTDTLTVQTSSSATALLQWTGGARDRSIFATICLGPGLLGLWLPTVRRRKLRLPTMLALCVALAGLGMLSGCGAASPNAAPGTYNIAVSIQVPGVGAQVVNATLVVR
jgi:hypothetical protein